MEWNGWRLIGRRGDTARDTRSRGGGACRGELFVHRHPDSNGDDTTANGAARTNSRRRDLCRINAKDGLALRTRDVHFTSKTDADRRESAPAISGGGGASVRRSMEYTDPGSVFA